MAENQLQVQQGPSMTPAQNKSPTEEWKAIPGFEGYYEASTLGNIRSVNRIISCPWGEVYPAAGKLKAKCKDRDGYYHVCLSKREERKMLSYGS